MLKWYFCSIQDFKMMQCNSILTQEDEYFQEIKADIDNNVFILVVYNVGVPWMILKDL